MAEISENGIVCKEEFDQYKARSIRAKFMDQIFLGVGGAVVFGIATALTGALIGLMPGIGHLTLGMATMGPILGIAAVALVGIACLYVGSKYVAQSILLDQDFQAKKIAQAAGRGAAPALTAEQGAAPVVGTGMRMEEADEQLQGDTKWAEKFSKSDTAKAWAEKMLQVQSESEQGAGKSA